jgi:serine/threonine-protein kinase
MVGTTAGKYRILEVIGRGSMGTVYRAQDTTLHRDVAIKTLNTDVVDPAAARRFRAEAVAVARLNHPRIAKVYDLIEHDGQLLMAMELVPGETLDSLVTRTGPLPVEKAAAFMSQALAALAHAHEMGVIHRDLKPANLMVADGRLKITDFGIARVAGAEHLTSVGFLMGTPAYMAPEQLLGREVDARTDVFAIGCVLYFLATAKLPFKGNTAMEIVESRLHDEPTPVKTVRSDLPEWFDYVLSRALARNPDARFQTAAEFKDALDRGLAGQPVIPPGTQSSSSEVAETMMPGAVPVMASTDRTPAGTGAYAQTVLTPVEPAVPVAPVVPVVPVVPIAPAKSPVVAIGAIATIIFAIGLGWWLWPKASSEPSTPPVTQQAATVTPAAVPDPGAVTAPTPVVTSAPVASPTPGVTGAPPSPSPSPIPPSSPASKGRRELDAPISFIAVKLLKVTGKRAEDVDATLTFGNGAISLAPRGDAANQMRPYDTLLAATFVKDRDPKWAPNLSAPPPDLDLPGSSLLNPLRRRGVRNWLVLQGQTFYIIMSFPDEESAQILAALAERTRVKLSQPGK